jgi:hypothetical protein
MFKLTLVPQAKNKTPALYKETSIYISIAITALVNMYRILEVPVLGADRRAVLAGPRGSPPITAAPHALHHRRK